MAPTQSPALAPAQSPAFKKAVVDSKKLTTKPSNDDLLELYALYKVGIGEDVANSPDPGMFDLKGKAKKRAWQAVVDDKVGPEAAQEKYVALVERLKESCGYDENKEPEAVGQS
ncbi:hypothetical protein XA68_15400 [Ophiocordyceps unilateralis]|uniref:ACB domain-containing protein n=1 Tax=Ophiocordyceps unilateralis TaxID=268505 RepID=A0A2A9P6X3_OPHUN|nr:hypothetical protein XA68_15400 [Ophiocordyceps unilateralis]